MTRILLGAVLIASGSGCMATNPSPDFQPLPARDAIPDHQYVIGAPDLLRVTVWKHPELSGEMPVRRDGKISVPLLDDVQASGLTPDELKASITKQLGKSISRPNVTVAVISPESQTVTVIGGVTTSGEIALRRNMGVMEAAAAAGGFTAWANKNDIRVVRMVDGTRVSYQFSYWSYMNGNPDADILLRPGDVVVVPE